MAPRHVACVSSQGLAAVSKVGAGENDAREFVTERNAVRVVCRSAKEIADSTQGAVLGICVIAGSLREGGIGGTVETCDAGSWNVGKGDVVVAVGEGQVVNELRADGAGEVRGEAKSGTNEIVFDGRHAVIDRSVLGAENGSIPLIVNIVGVEFLFRSKVVIDADEFLAPYG